MEYFAFAISKEFLYHTFIGTDCFRTCNLAECKLQPCLFGCLATLQKPMYTNVRCQALQHPRYKE